MDFDDDAKLDTSQVGEGGGGRIPGGGLTIGGGAVGIVGLIIALIFGIDPGNLTGGGGGGQPAPASDLSENCKTGADADQKEKCRVVGVVNSIQKYWGDNLKGYQVAKTILFTQAVQTGCGNATSDVGPFYCPADQRVYLDLGFFDDLQSKFGAEGGPFAQAYVIGHEYGHHVQHLLGTDQKVGGDREGADSGSVRLELQADCYAGVWAKHGVDTKFFKEPFTKTDIQQALSAAAAVGDDRIQQSGGGGVDPEKWTHGSSAQRVQWFTTGYDSGEPDQCDTFSAPLNG
ncbi:KPN_02809 family neutral zinc metallopeptidase [Actinocorallia longicatena]|uniref:Neutral zinc metallopeptidase n=1 Tax=Actinocorallia longicatena TaxID=111803 RepID=A0ABP6Q939_9ACTN